MSASAGLLGVATDVLILFVLAATVVSSRFSQVIRPFIASLSFIGSWLLTAVTAALRAPIWTVGTGVAVTVIAIVVTLVTLQLWTQEGGHDDDRPGQQGNDGGGGPLCRRPRAPKSGGDGSDPSWWPEFERQLASYVSDCEFEKRRSAAISEKPPAPVTIRPPDLGTAMTPTLSRGP